MSLSSSPKSHSVIPMLPTLVTNDQLSKIKRVLQDHLTDGIVVIVGSGLSCGEGLPSMGGLVDWLEKASLPTMSAFDIREWSRLIVDIKKRGLEAALKSSVISDATNKFIREEIGLCIRQAEQQVINEVISGKKELKFSNLLKHLPQTRRFPVITTNYDRLIELAAESAGFLVDTRSLGNHFAPFSKSEGAYTFARKVVPIKNGHRKIEDHVISLYKPHGSLDWIDFQGTPVRCAFASTSQEPLIITPGVNKYRSGYSQPFDMHRELANDAIDKADKLLLIGYGFNDDHLETHLSQKINSGTQTVMLTYKLTDNAKAFLRTNPLSVWAIESSSPIDGTGTIVYNGNSEYYITNESLWDTDGFVKGVF